MYMPFFPCKFVGGNGCKCIGALSDPLLHSKMGRWCWAAANAMKIIAEVAL